MLDRCNDPESMFASGRGLMLMRAFADEMFFNRDGNEVTLVLYADADGNYAYFHVNYMPRRNEKFDWTKPVDGSDPDSDYKGLHALDDLPNLLNPASGWVLRARSTMWKRLGHPWVAKRRPLLLLGRQGPGRQSRSSTSRRESRGR